MIEEKENKVETLEPVALVEDRVTKTTRIGTTLSSKMRTRLIEFLKENLDIFAWSHEDMPGISPKIIQHKLNMNPRESSSSKDEEPSPLNETKQLQKKLQNY